MGYKDARKKGKVKMNSHVSVVELPAARPMEKMGRNPFDADPSMNTVISRTCWISRWMMTRCESQFYTSTTLGI